jgi:hypothetical protein
MKFINFLLFCCVFRLFSFALVVSQPNQFSVYQQVYSLVYVMVYIKLQESHIYKQNIYGNVRIITYTKLFYAYDVTV